MGRWEHHGTGKKSTCPELPWIPGKVSSRSREAYGRKSQCGVHQQIQMGHRHPQKLAGELAEQVERSCIPRADGIQQGPQANEFRGFHGTGTR